MVFGLAYFTPATGFAGGALIGLSAAVLLLLSGDILGASGLVSSTVLTPRKTIFDPSVTWKLVFLSTFLLISNTVLGLHFTKDERLGEDPSIPVVSTYGYLLGGLFVGFGTRLGNGCTTGHGICGMARFSKRSFVAVCSFMMTAVAVACLTAPDNQATRRYTAFLRTSDLDDAPALFNRWLGLGISAIIVVPTILSLANLFGLFKRSSEDSTFFPEPKSIVEKPRDSKLADPEASGCTFICEASSDKMDVDSSKLDIEKGQSEPENEITETEDQSEEVVATQDEVEANLEAVDQQHQDNVRKLGPAVLSGSIFAVGLAVSGMVLPSKILGFLNLFLMSRTTSSYDPTLMTVMMGGMGISMISYQFIEHHRIMKTTVVRECPLLTSKFAIPTNTVIDLELIVGGVCFGAGWAIAGLCPGPALFLAATGTQPVIFGWWPAFLAGSMVAQKLKR